MSGPRRHGARVQSAACALVLLTLVIVLVHGSGAWAHTIARPARVPVVAARAGRLPLPTSGVTTDDAPRPANMPILDLATSLAALTLVLMAGIGLIVYRAGYRGERDH